MYAINSIFVCSIVSVRRSKMLHCVVPENIHTPITEGISHETLGLTHFLHPKITTPPLWNFQEYYVHPIPSGKIHFF